MKNLLPLLTLACLVSCQPIESRPGHGGPWPGVGPGVPSAGIDVTKPRSLLGKPLGAVQAACAAAGVNHRVIEVDGVPRPHTLDFRPDRLNFKVNAGRVTAVTRG